MSRKLKRAFTIVELLITIVKLAADGEWFVQTPTEITLHNGVVIAVKTHDH